MMLALLIALSQDVLDANASDQPRAHDIARSTKNGDIVVAWANKAGDVQVRRFSAQSAWDAPVVVGSGAKEVSLAYGSDTWLVVWSTGDEVDARLLDANGAPAGSAFRVSDVAAAGDDTAPEAAWNAGKWLVVWSHTNMPLAQGRARFTASFDINDDVRGRFVTPSGAGAASFPIAEDALDSKNPSVAAAGDGFLTSWQEHPGKNRSPRVWGAPVSATGEVGLAAPYGIGTGANQVRPQVSSRADGESMMVWGAEGAVGARRVQTDGKYAGKAVRIPNSDGGTPSIVHVPERGQYLVVYERGTEQGGLDVYGMWVDERTGESRGVDRLMRSRDHEHHGRAAMRPNGEPLTVAASTSGPETKLVVTYETYKGVDNSNHGTSKTCGGSATGPAGAPCTMIALAVVLALGLARRIA